MFSIYIENCLSFSRLICILRLCFVSSSIDKGTILARAVSSKINVACLISGGVDSLIAAYLLKQRPSLFNLTGVHISCWKDDNDSSSSYLSQCNSQDFDDAKGVAKFLNIDLHHLDLSKQYWNEVFDQFLESYKNGETPNPDILCNKRIKFKTVIEYAKSKLGCDAIATGHYVGSSFGTYWQYRESNQDGAKLLRAWNKSLDQTFFLSQVSQEGIKSSIFPLQYYNKSECRNLAMQLGLTNVATKHKSDGICFIGAKKFQKFIDHYLPRNPGPFIDIDSGKLLGEHGGLHFWTLGQRTRMNAKCKYYVVAKNLNTNTIMVSSDKDHPVLIRNIFRITELNWISEEPKFNEQDGTFSCEFKFQQLDKTESCLLERFENGDDCLRVRLDRPKRALTIGQYCALYKENECIGSGRIFDVE